MDVKYCDLCKKRINQGDKVYYLKYGENSAMSFMGGGKSGEVCNNCIEKIRSFVRGLKKELK